MNPVETYYSTLSDSIPYYAGYDEDDRDFSEIERSAQFYYENNLQPASFADPDLFRDA